MTLSMKVILSLAVIGGCLLEVFASEDLSVEPRYQYHSHNVPSKTHTAPTALASHGTKAVHARSQSAVTEIRKSLADTELNLIKILRNLYFKEPAIAKCSTEKILEFYQAFLQALREEAACLPALEKTTKANALDFDLSASKKRIEVCQSKTDPTKIASCVATETLSEGKKQLRALSYRWNTKLEKDLADKIGVMHDCHKKAMTSVLLPVDALKKNLVVCREVPAKQTVSVVEKVKKAPKGPADKKPVGPVQEKVKQVPSPAAPVQEKVKEVPSLAAQVQSPAAPVQEKVKEVPSQAAQVQEKVKEVPSLAAQVQSPAAQVQEKVKEVPTSPGDKSKP